MASVAEIDGLTVPVALTWSPTLDTYTGAAAGYSVRLLRTAYKTGGGDIMRVRRASDNIEVDVGFDSNEEFGLTSPVSNPSSGGPFTDFADFVGHTGTPTDAFCRSWYDQSGNGHDASQPTAGRQPKIYDSSTGIVQQGATTARPALFFDQTDDRFEEITGLTTFNTNDLGMFAVAKNDNNDSFVTAFTAGNGSGTEVMLAYRGHVFLYCGTTTSGDPALTQKLHSLYADNATNDVKGYQDQVQKATYSVASNSHTSIFIGQLRSFTTSEWAGTIQEVIFYPSSTKADHADIETSENDYFDIF
jgi:hypothetical protein